MGLRDIGAALPPGFRFYPSDEELVCHYLYKKIANEEVLKGTLVEIDLHTCEPWQLPEVAKLNATEWYFFSFRDRKYATGFRTNRATTSGYWKATGKDRMVLDPTSRELVGMRKTLVFYRNRAPNGIKSGWIMHEFRLETPHMPPKEDWVLCRVFHKSRSGDNSTKLSPPFLFETTAANNASSYINSAASPALTDTSTMPFGYHPQQISSSTPPYQNHSSQTSSRLNLLQYSQEKNTNQVTEITSECDDEYGFLWDMNLEETSLENGVAPNMEDIRFEMDNGMVFL
uniref:NAC transcription factor 66 n=1 Tax=Litchi chinensis TaxID=151069 RepID=A0A8K1MBZ6_LITCN|nr:NAC transcription factor 66 [Litchi chinensis]